MRPRGFQVGSAAAGVGLTLGLELGEVGSGVGLDGRLGTGLAEGSNEGDGLLVDGAATSVGPAEGDPGGALGTVVPQAATTGSNNTMAIVRCATRPTIDRNLVLLMSVTGRYTSRGATVAKPSIIGGAARVTPAQVAAGRRSLSARVDLSAGRAIRDRPRLAPGRRAGARWPAPFRARSGRS